MMICCWCIRVRMQFKHRVSVWIWCFTAYTQGVSQWVSQSDSGGLLWLVYGGLIEQQAVRNNSLWGGGFKSLSIVNIPRKFPFDPFIYRLENTIPACSFPRHAPGKGSIQSINFAYMGHIIKDLTIIRTQLLHSAPTKLICRKSNSFSENVPRIWAPSSSSSATYSLPLSNDLSQIFRRVLWAPSAPPDSIKGPPMEEWAEEKEPIYCKLSHKAPFPSMVVIH